MSVNIIYYDSGDGLRMGAVFFLFSLIREIYLIIILFNKVLSLHARKKMEALVSEVFCAINSHNRNRW